MRIKETITPLKLPVQRGFSLVELMVAVLVSLLLLGGVIQIMLTKRDTYNFQQAQSLTQENARFSFLFLEQTLQKTGFRQRPQTKAKVAFDNKGADVRCASFAPGQVVADSLEGDGVCIRYQEFQATGVDCLGNDIPDASSYVVERIFYSAANKDLRCAAQDAAAQALTEGIEDFSVRFGLDLNGDRVADRYVDEPANTEWSRVVSLRFDVLTVAAGFLAPSAQTYRFPLDAAADTTASDKRLYRVASRTIALKNIVL